MPFKFNPFIGNLDFYSTGITGPNSSTDKSIVRWNGTSGTVVQDGPGTLVQDNGAIQAQTFIGDRQFFGTTNIPTNYTMLTDSIEMQPGAVISMNPGSKIIIL